MTKSIPLCELTSEELLLEWLHWNNEVKAAKECGAALAAAIKFLEDAESEINRRAGKK